MENINYCIRKKTGFGYLCLRVFGVFIFCFQPDIAESLVKSKADAHKLAGVLGGSGLPDYQSDRSADQTLQWLSSVAVMLAQNSATNAEEYVSANDQAKGYWQQKIDRLFCGGDKPAHMHDPVKAVIRYLRLCGV